MALVSPTEAIRLSGRSKAAFYKDIKDGKVSASKNESGKTVFDTAELSRAYGALKRKTSTAVLASDFLGPSETQEMRSLLREVEHLKSLLNVKDEQIQTLKDTMRLLEYRVSTPVQSETSQDKVGFLGRIFGRR